MSLFFHEHKDKLDKTQIGEVLGKEPESSFVKDEGADPEKGGEGFYVRNLHPYVDAMDFTDFKFDDAMRQFFSGFRLPGEAQKVSAYKNIHQFLVIRSENKFLTCTYKNS